MRPDSHLVYDIIEGYTAEYSVDELITSAASEHVKSLDDVSWISGIRESNWGRTAWLIQFQPEPARAEEFASALSVSPAKATPYASDLSFSQTQWVWEVDQASGLIVSREWLALSQPEPTILYAEEYSQPEIMPATTLPHELETFITPEAVQLRSNIEAVTSIDATEAERLMVGVTTPITEVASNLSFPVYSLAPTGIEQIPAESHNFRIYFAPQNSCHRYLPLAFDFDLCAGLGQTTRLEYMFWSSEDQRNLKAVSILQGKAEEIVPLLKQTPPRWHVSMPVTLDVKGQLVEGWSVPALHGNQNTKALMFELEGTFIQIGGFSTTLDELVMVAENLQHTSSVSPSATIEIHRVFIPLVTQ